MNQHELKQEIDELKERIDVLEAANFILVELLYAENPRLESLVQDQKNKIKTRGIAHEVAVSYLTGTFGDDHLANLRELRVGNRPND